MPFKVRYDIYEPGKQAACLTTYDRQYARAEFNDRQKKPGMALTRMLYTIEPEDLTKSEEYVWLVYQVRNLQKHYWANGKQRDDLMASLAKEKELDSKNTNIRYHLQKHPKCQIDDAAAYQFFITVEDWRSKWKAYFAAKNTGDHKATAELYIECRELEKRIDEHIKQVIGL